MENFKNEGTLELKIEDIHPEDGYAYLKDEIIGKQFIAGLTLSSTGHPGWYTIVGTFAENTDIPELDAATSEQPIVITMAKYSL